MAEIRDKPKIVPNLRKITNDLHVGSPSTPHFTLLSEIKKFQCEENSVNSDTESLLGVIDKNDTVYMKSCGNFKGNNKKLTRVEFTDEFQSVMSTIRTNTNVENNLLHDEIAEIKSKYMHNSPKQIVHQTNASFLNPELTINQNNETFKETDDFKCYSEVWNYDGGFDLNMPEVSIDKLNESRRKCLRWLNNQ